MYINVKKLPEQTFNIFVFYIWQIESKVYNTLRRYMLLWKLFMKWVALIKRFDWFPSVA